MEYFSMVFTVIGVIISVWFASSAKKDAEKAQSTLDAVNKAIEGWQDKVMTSTISILDSQPQVIKAKTTMAKIETAQQLIKGLEEAIKEMSQNPQSGASGHTQEQLLYLLTSQIEKTLQGIDEQRNTDADE